MADATIGQFLNELANEKSQIRRKWLGTDAERNAAVDEYRDAAGNGLGDKHKKIIKTAGKDRQNPDLTQVQAECQKETPPCNTNLWVK